MNTSIYRNPKKGNKNTKKKTIEIRLKTKLPTRNS